YPENCWFTLSYSPIRDDTGGVGGLLAVVAETTGRVQSERRLATLRELARRSADAKTAEEACENAAGVFEKNPIDVPFALFYLIDQSGQSAQRIACIGLDTDCAAAPHRVDLSEMGLCPWPLDAVAQAGKTEVLTDLAERFGVLPGGPYPEPTHTAILLPLSRPG